MAPGSKVNNMSTSKKV
ncbi:hypothetical protein FG05_35095 [Fusarium graminearum]|nr:hypothetical protein FG05_35095 [Fusarium graminearum]